MDKSDKVLITGGTGFVGSHLVEELISQGFKQIHVTTLSDKATHVHTLLPETQIHQLDLADNAKTSLLIEQLQPKWLFHLAAYAMVGKSFQETYTVLDTNIKIQLSLLEAIKSKSPETRILVVGSALEYDFIKKANPDFDKKNHHNQTKTDESELLGPVSPYAVSKVLQDLLGLSYFYSYSLNVIRVRPFNHIGERQTTDFAIASFAHQIVQIERHRQNNIRVGNLDAVRDFTDVKDVCRAYILLMEKGETGKVYNIGSGDGKTIREVLDVLCSLANNSISIETDQNRIRPLDIPYAVADNSRITALGWKPQYTLSQTLERILNYWRNTV